jgi:membrane-bound lytic murein transglycosylase A
MPILNASVNETPKYKVPLYGLPSNLIQVNLANFRSEFQHQHISGRIIGNNLVPFYTRAEINKGAIKNTAQVLFWLDNPIDRVFLEIEGSGILKLENGEQIYIGYAGENGAPYTSIAKVLINQGVIERKFASSENIKNYLNAHPDKIDQVLNQNKSFVFFRIQENHAALGAQGVDLTPGYSLAVDPKWISYGTPTWLSTTLPINNHDKIPFNRLMIAQDTGGAIRGAVRGDIYWGSGQEASSNANKMQERGRYWLLLPRQIIERFNKAIR